MISVSTTTVHANALPDQALMRSIMKRVLFIGVLSQDGVAQRRDRRCVTGKRDRTA
jgi:hypothetical protein